MNSEIFIPLILSLIVMLAWGINAFLTAKISRKMGSLHAGFWILFIGFFLTFVLAPFFYSVPKSINFLGLLFFGIVGAGVYVIYCRSLEIGKISLVAPITSSWALVSSLLGLTFLKEPVSFLKMISVLGVILGIIIVSVDWKPPGGTKNRRLPPGVLSALFVASGWGVTFYLLAPLSRQMGWYFTTLASRVLMAVSLFPIVFYRGRMEKVKAKISWGMLFIVGILDTLAFTTYNLAVSRYEVSYVSVISSASPLVAILLSAIFLGEKLKTFQKIGVAFIIGGILGLNI